jgi:hypothetical protein
MKYFNRLVKDKNGKHYVHSERSFDILICLFTTNEREITREKQDK